VGLRLLLDATIPTATVGRLLATHGHDVAGLNQEPALDGLDDDAVLELATRDASVLVTANTADYPRILREWASLGRSHSGVILLHGGDPTAPEIVLQCIDLWIKRRPKQENWIDFVALADVGAGAGGRRPVPQEL
jgi:predicted nuclease of predicted toxin-antitoxin system